MDSAQPFDRGWCRTMALHSSDGWIVSAFIRVIRGKNEIGPNAAHAPDHATKSSGANISIFWAATASLTLRTVTAVRKADSAGQFNGVFFRIALKKFSRCGWWIA